MIAIILAIAYLLSCWLWFRWLRRTFGRQLTSFEPQLVTFGLLITSLCWPLVWAWVMVRVKRSRVR